MSFGPKTGFPQPTGRKEPSGRFRKKPTGFQQVELGLVDDGGILDVTVEFQGVLLIDVATWEIETVGEVIERLFVAKRAVLLPCSPESTFS